MKKNVFIISPSHDDFEDKVAELYEIYNVGRMFSDLYIVTGKEKNMYLAYVDGVAGGVLMDAWSENGNGPYFGSVMCAAFEEGERRKGNLKACIDTLNHFGKTLPECLGGEWEIEIIQLNPDDNKEVWNNLGFTVEGMANFTITVSKRPLEDMFPNKSKTSEEDVADYFMRILKESQE